MKTYDVFGIAPQVREYSYVDRGNLDKKFESLLGRTLHIAIRGPSKCGKSWLRQKALKNSIIVQCRHNKPFTDIYVDALSQLDIRTEVKESTTGTFRANLTAGGEVGFEILAKASAGGGVEYQRAKTIETSAVGQTVADLRFIIEVIKASGKRLVIEDFHYMTVNDRRSFAFDLKALWDYGIYVIIVGVWSESNLLIHLNSDLTGRIHEIAIDWTKDDLKKILDKGCLKLNIETNEDINNLLAELAYSNAGIIQTLALATLDEANIKESSFFKQFVTNVGLVESATMDYAEQLNPQYQQFAKKVSNGIRSRQGSTGIYARALAVILDATDEELTRGLPARTIYQRAVLKQPRIQFGNLKTILEKIEGLQIDSEGRGLVIAYNEATDEVTIVDRQLLLYRRYSTVKWPWETLIEEADASGGQIEADRTLVSIN